MTDTTVPVTDDEGPCTDCRDTGITIHTERACSCDAGNQHRLAAEQSRASTPAGSDWFAGEVDCDGNELVTIRTDELQRLRDEREKFMWQVRDTCARAEKAEAALRASTPAVDRGARDWVNSIPGVKPTDQFIALDRTLFEDCIERAILALHPPVMGEVAKEALALRNIEAAITQYLRNWEGSSRGDAFSVALSIVQKERATLSTEQVR